MPLTSALTVEDLAMSMKLPVIIVSANRLGMLNHAAHGRGRPRGRAHHRGHRRQQRHGTDQRTSRMEHRGLAQLGRTGDAHHGARRVDGDDAFALRVGQ